MQEKYIKVKNIEAGLGKRIISYIIVYIIGDKYLMAPKRPNKGRKYNNNTFKNRNYRIKRLALLSRGLNKQPKI